MKYGFIGCGNMGGALATALSKTTKDIMLSDLDKAKASELAKKLGVSVGDNTEVINTCDRIFFGVKPQVIEQMIRDIKDDLKNRNVTIITMAAGVQIKSIEEYIGVRLPIIRIMPNTPVFVGEGMILYCTNDLVSSETVESFIDDMRFAGVIDYLDESLINAGCSVSGCGPAFMYMFAEFIAKGGAECGLNEDKALRYAAQTMLGSAKMLLNSEKSAKELRENVCSKGGSTIEGVNSLFGDGIDTAAVNAVKAAYKRNMELGAKK